MEAIQITVKIDPFLKRSQNKGFSVHLNGAVVGDIFPGDVLRFTATEEENLVQVSFVNKELYWAESTYSFEAKNIEGPLELEITVINMLIVLKRI